MGLPLTRNVVSDLEGVLRVGARVTPLGSISPSHFTSIRQCALKAVWAANRAPALLPVTPAARVGSVIHQLLEEAGHGRFLGDGRPGAEKRWSDLILTAEEEMRRSWLDRHLIPLSESLADFEVRRIQTIERALEIDGARSLVEPREGPRPAQGYGFELPVSSEDGLVRGRIDAVLPSKDGPVIRDYKSGAIFDSGHGLSHVVKEAYSTQLRLYAAMYAETTRVWPARLEVVPVLGRAQLEPIDRPACVRLLDEARACLRQLDTIIAQPRQRAQDLEAKLAHPTPANCSVCPYRPGCTPYRAASSGQKGWPNDLWGRSRDIRQLGNSSLMIVVERPEGVAVRVRGLSSDPSRHPGLQGLRSGDEVAMFNLKATSSAEAFGESPFTVVYRLSHGDSKARPGQNQTDCRGEGG